MKGIRRDPIICPNPLDPIGVKADTATPFSTTHPPKDKEDVGWAAGSLHPLTALN